jgi:hypothetical protein
MIGSCALLELGAETGVTERENIAALYDGEMNRGRRAVLWVSPHNVANYILVILDHSPAFRVTIPDAVLIQFNLLMMSMLLLETCRGM